MSRRTLWIASPIEPSGASWILNCLLELGVVVHHRPVERNVFRRAGGMWIAEPDGVRLHPRAGVLAKWMPALGRPGARRFRDDVEVVYVQEPPPVEAPEGPGLLFVRDPRDAIWSAFARLRPELDFAAFVAWPNAHTLLDRPRHWARFVEAWIARPGVRPFRFEDYKRDDVGTLERALAHLEIDASRDDLVAAAAASTFERAKAGEARYRERHPGDAEVANRAGRVGDFEGRPDVAASIARITAGTAPVAGSLGYASGARASPDDAAGDRERLLDFAAQLDAGALARAKVPTLEARELVASLARLAGDDAPALTARLASLATALADGGEYHGRQIAALLRSRRRDAAV